MSISLPVPCLHRIHRGEPSIAHQIHQSLGVSLELTDLMERLDGMERRAREMSLPLHSALVTFDDGWADPLMLSNHFAAWPHLQPVLFLTRHQFEGDQSLLPLPRLYAWCAEVGVSLKDLAKQGIERKALKTMREQKQHALLDQLGVPRIHTSPEVLSPKQVHELMRKGWIIGSHGHDHHDLRFDPPAKLTAGLKKALQVTLKFRGEPWLAWPEGRCTEQTCEIAQSVGFKKQFSLRVEAEHIHRVDLVHRDIWR